MTLVYWIFGTAAALFILVALLLWLLEKQLNKVALWFYRKFWSG